MIRLLIIAIPVAILCWWAAWVVAMSFGVRGQERPLDAPAAVPPW